MVAFAEIDAPDEIDAGAMSGEHETTVMTLEGEPHAGSPFFGRGEMCSAKQGRGSFTGYVADNESSMLYARARMYSPGLGRFVNRDNWMYRQWSIAGVLGEVRSRSTPEHEKTAKIEKLAALYQAMGVFSEATFLELRKAMRNQGTPGPTSGDGYQDGSNLYSAYFVPNTTDPSGQECGVEICVRPLAAFGDSLPWWLSPANHAYLQIGSWSAGYQADSVVYSPEQNPNHSGKKCWPAKRKSDGSLPDGTKCCDATCDQIVACIKNEAASGSPGTYGVVSNNCGDWVKKTLDKCCMVGSVPWHIY